MQSLSNRLTQPLMRPLMLLGGLLTADDVLMLARCLSESLQSQHADGTVCDQLDSHFVVICLDDKVTS